MRLGLLGPARGDVGALGRAAELLLNGARVHRAIYLGNDGALERAVTAWSKKLVGDDPSDDAAWTRAVDVALTGTPQALDRFVANERARHRLKALEVLPGGGASHGTLRIGPYVAFLAYDRTQFAEVDVGAADVVFFGNSDAPTARRIGRRWLITPGPLGSRSGGLAIVEERDQEVDFTLLDASGRPTRSERLFEPRSPELADG